jgi:hypothetical protein
VIWYSKVCSGVVRYIDIAWYDLTWYYKFGGDIFLLGYQRELSYQHRDGSYSAFGDKYGKPRPGSLW